MTDLERAALERLLALVLAQVDDLLEVLGEQRARLGRRQRAETRHERLVLKQQIHVTSASRDET